MDGANKQDGDKPGPSNRQNGQRSENSTDTQEEGLHHSEEDPLVAGSSGQGQEERRGVGEADLHQGSCAQHGHLAERLDRLQAENQAILAENQAILAENQAILAAIEEMRQQFEVRIQQLVDERRRRWIPHQLIKWSLHILIVAGIVATYVIYAGKDFSTFAESSLMDTCNSIFWGALSSIGGFWSICVHAVAAAVGVLLLSISTLLPLLWNRLHRRQ